MGENRIEASIACFREHSEMLICAVKMIWRKQFQIGVQIIIIEFHITGSDFSNTPVLQYSNTPFGLFPELPLGSNQIRDIWARVPYLPPAG